MNNPLLHVKDLPTFTNISEEMIGPAIRQIITDNLAEIERLLQQPEYSWDNLISPLNLLEDKLSKAWSPVRHLNSVKSNDKLRDAHNACLPLLADYSSKISQNRKLFEAISSIVDSAAYAAFNTARQKSLQDALRSFRLGGVDLEGDDKSRFQQLKKDLSDLESRYENNLLDATQAWQWVTSDEQELSGLPGYALAMLKQSAEQKQLDGYRITLEMPSYLAVMTYADNRELRKRVYDAFCTRASDQGITDKKWDNADIMQQIVVKRREKAKILGFNSYAELSLETKMAESVEEVMNFLRDLAKRSRPAAEREARERQEYASSLGFEGELEPWDYAYYSEKLKNHRYQFREEDLKPYFSDKQVIDGLFKITSQLFDVDIIASPDKVDTWDEQVGFFHIRDKQGQLVGKFFLDLYARENKRGGAWMDECVNRYRIDNHLQIPVAYLTCNLTPPIGDQPALFTHDEVITVFHEFGHGLHHMLTRIDEPDVSGINGVEWDAVELPSQFMENYCWQRDALELIARHFETGEALPRELYNKMYEARNFESALQMLRQIEFALFDMLLFDHQQVETSEQIQQVLDQVRTEVSVLKTAPYNRFQNGFSHIFAGGYAAGYYSYKWAEVLSADAFSAFEEEGILNSDTGQRFLNCVLQQGGSRPAMESFCCFRGRKPSIDALLRHSGISEADALESV